MRGRFNDTCSFRYGPRSTAGVPGVVWAAGVPCREVLQNQIAQRQSPLDLATHWLTFDQVDPHGPLTNSPYLGAIFTDYLAADEVAVNAAPGFWYSLCRIERVSHPLETPYWRGLLIPATSIVVPPWPPATADPDIPPGLLTVGVTVRGVQNLDTPSDPTVNECEVFVGSVVDAWSISTTFVGINAHGFAVVTVQVLRNGVVVGSMLNQFHQTPGPVLLSVTYGSCPV